MTLNTITGVTLETLFMYSGTNLMYITINFRSWGEVDPSVPH